MQKSNKVKMNRMKVLGHLIESLFHNFWYKVDILFGGGQFAYVAKRIGVKPSQSLVYENLAFHVRCKYSVHNGLWCNLPCLFCKKFKSKEKGEKDGSK